MHASQVYDRGGIIGRFTDAGRGRAKLMSRRKGQTMLVAAAIGLMTVAPMASAKNPEQMALAPESPTALVVLKTDFWTPAADMKSAYKLWMTGYDAEAGKQAAGSAVFEAQKKKLFNGYLMAPIKPGRWVFQSYAQQDKWALCFNARSWQFEVKAGEVVYLGQFDALAHRKQLEEAAILSGKVAFSGYGFADFFDLPDAPLFKPVDDKQVADLRDALAMFAPRVTAPVRAATFSPAAFGTGSTLFAERKCGGYFATSANKKDKVSTKKADTPGGK
jgi:hypothetical protein